MRDGESELERASGPWSLSGVPEKSWIVYF